MFCCINTFFIPFLYFHNQVNLVLRSPYINFVAVHPFQNKAEEAMAEVCLYAVAAHIKIILS